MSQPNAAPIESPNLKNVPLSSISPSTKNPRLTLEKKKFAELKASIMSNGLLQPIAVRVVDDNFEIVGGHRRYFAVKELAHEHPDDARFASVPVLVIDAADQGVAALRLAENVNRADLAPREVAEGIIDALESGMTEEELAARLGWGIRNVYRYTQFHEAPAWLREFAVRVPNPVKKVDDAGNPVINPKTGAAIMVDDDLPALLFTHVHELVTLYNVLHQHDVQQLDEIGESYKPQAEKTVRKLARAASKEEWSAVRLRKEIARVKDPPSGTTSSRSQKNGAQKSSAPFTVTKERVAIDLTRTLNDAQRADLANLLTTALSAFGIMAVKIDDAR
jgi:ParB/RepB/Spo0J family partition protein